MTQQTTPCTPAISATCKPTQESPIVVVTRLAPLKVTYIIDIVSADTLQIPYAVAINGKVLSVYAERAMNAPAASERKATATRPARPAQPARIVIPATVGDTVSLYLNSDAAPARRTRPLYTVTLDDRSVEVRITEKMGLHHDPDKPVFKGHNATTETDEYTASLTGNIWMSVSHVYQGSDVEAYMPQGTRAEVVRAVRSIYEGLSTPRLKIAGAGYALDVEFVDSDNPRQNIPHYRLLADGVTRVHPAGYAALFNSAIDNQVQSIQVTSCWRPMLGSIAHRLGLGLDVNYVGDVRLNRKELTTGTPASKDADANVSEEEVVLFRQMKMAKEERERLEKGARKAGNTGDATAKAAANKEFDDAVSKERLATQNWDAERNKHEPPQVRNFRSSLLRCACVGQLFDPWYMYENAQAEGKANRQETANETSHANHLHITVRDRKIFIP